ncbi:CRISPR-associated helicase Cas3' [uncultured Methanosphaera sp.]|uniref:CRISPR-associated helicase Cas3' n=1 Tax=uncultured Methanosphaera sp. TaxID=262501 RepID=UPI00280523E0|nr:CRISPR-associated helicase Cas3' [uncultured Methanosphaera sp.]
MLSCTNEIYSHPDKKLEEHLLNVANNSKEVFQNLCIEDNKLYAEISFLVGLSHDFAKSTSYFQKYLKDHQKTEKAYHSFLSAIFGYYVTCKYLDKNNISERNLPLISYLSIKSHHGNLKDVYDGQNAEFTKIKEIPKYVDLQVEDLKKAYKSGDLDDLEKFYQKYGIQISEFFEEYENLKVEIKKKLKKFSRQKDIENYLLVLLFFSVLIDSDKFDASKTDKFERRKIESNIVDLYKNENLSQNKDTQINKLRNETYDLINKSVENINLDDDKIFSITLPTGSGKTLSAFSFALKLREKIEKQYNFTPRIIYSLPFLSIIDQNEKVIKNILKNADYKITSDIITRYDSTANMKYEKDENTQLDINKSEMLIEGWYSEIIITTFFQVFHTIFSNQNKSLRKLHNMANSIIILDEIQTIPVKYWQLLNQVLKKISEKYNVWFIFMSATQPAIYEENEIQPLIKDETKYSNILDRVNYNFNHEPIEIDTFKENILEEIEKQKDKNIMIVLNTIDSSQQIYKHIQENLNDENTTLYYLSTNIIPKQRKKRIDEIKNKDNTRKIIITTQLIEAGVDIDVDIIYRDFTVIDSLIQTAGRCNRNNKKQKGEVNIIKLENENKKQYNKFIYDQTLLDITENITKQYKQISEKEFNNTTLNKYYKEIKDKKSQDKSNELIEALEKLKLTQTQNFNLIEEKIEKIDVFIELDDDATKIWKQYQEIRENKKLKNYEKKREYKKIQNQLRNYIISVDTKKLGTTPQEDKIFFISKEDIERKYDKQTGFIPQQEEEIFII